MYTSLAHHVGIHKWFQTKDFSGLNLKVIDLQFLSIEPSPNCDYFYTYSYSWFTTDNVSYITEGFASVDVYSEDPYDAGT